MPYLLRRKLVCFYCGHKSSQNRHPSIRQFRCAECDAVNYLDENGDITDVPASASPDRPQQYAVEQSRSISPDLSSASDNIFCPTCQKNQNFQLQALATYLPDPSDPKYREYEANLPTYRKQLEERYPQVCPNCVRLVNNRLESMTYLARTENLKLSLERTRNGQAMIYGRSNAKDLVILAGALAWWISILGQLIWHGLGIIVDNTIDSRLSFPSCVASAFVAQQTGMSCYSEMTDVLQYFLLAGLLSIWWNNKISGSATGQGRLTNLNDYYFLQVLFLGARACAFWFLKDPNASTSLPPHAIHGFMIVFTIVCTLSSMTVVKFQKRPVIGDYKLQRVEATGAAPLTLEDTNFFPSGASPQAPNSGFPLSALAPTTPQHARSARQPSVISTSLTSLFDRNRLSDSGDTGSEMDWSPTTPTFTPRQAVQPRHPQEDASTPTRNSFSAFNFDLPPAPVHPAHAAVRPRAQAKFARAPEETRTQFAQAFGLGGKGGLLPAESRGREMEMRNPRIQVPEAETGLESLFNNVFSLKDEPAVQVDTAVPCSAGGRKWAGAAFWTILIAVPLGLGVAFWVGNGQLAGKAALDDLEWMEKS
ncbi:hypothetical protein BT63DRAFT_430146 [Microthyrium microscopicum]|uniref:Ima1 N-terminal domain-containing protein n=1 Tax=Microthyrium microscopicum TaxID=703497 RepID=A0A6A6TXJ2_9PEZI|nr:hypothetical protein BT63DRAFT_430146 [Microthyrium microscopicum]